MYFFPQKVLEDVHPQNRKLRKKEAWETESIYIKESKGRGKLKAKEIFELTAVLWD